MAAMRSAVCVAGLFLGIGVVKVQEMLRYQEMTLVPLAPGPVEGLINLRGQIVSPSIRGEVWA